MTHLNMGSNTGKSGLTKVVQCNMGFGRFIKNTHFFWGGEEAGCFFLWVSFGFFLGFFLGPIHFLVFGFLRFHHNCFRDTISWECIVEDDCVRSCLMELQSFSLSKLNVDPVHRILVHFPLLTCKMQDVVWSYWILMILMHGIHGCKERI